jgi:hypothetical protein
VPRRILAWRHLPLDLCTKTARRRIGAVFRVRAVRIRQEFSQVLEKKNLLKKQQL